jgi:hypothetical protein
MASAEVDLMDYEPEEDDMMGNDTTMDDGNERLFPLLRPN